VKVSCLHFAFSLGILGFVACPGTAAAFSRTTNPWTVSVGLGDPAPSLIGVSLAYQSNESLQWRGGTGFFSWDDLQIQSFGASARVHVLPTRLTPLFGGGLDLLVFRGSGNLQGLGETTLLGSLTAGLDWAITDNLRTAAGFTFHFPLRLNFPFFEIGFMF